jgi:Xaa-Pro aminopeptidase
METERTRLADAMRAAGADCAVLSSFGDIRYATGFDVPPPIDAGAAFAYGPTLAAARADGHVELLVPSAYGADARDRSEADETTLVPAFDHSSSLDAGSEFAAAVTRGVAGCRGRAIAVDAATLPLAVARLLEGERLGDVRPIMRAARLVKTPREIDLIRRAVGAADEGQTALLELARPGANEVDVMGAVVARVQRFAGRAVPWAGELVSGPRVAVLRYPGGPFDRDIEPGDSVLMDLSVRVCGYWSDCCNTLVAGAEPTGEQLRYFRAARAAFEAAVETLRPGRRASDAHAAAAAALGEHGFQPAHYTGHQVGTTVNEEPRLVPYDDTPIEAGMVFAFEPGAYAGPDGTTGARTEKVVLVTDDGPEVISHFAWGMPA